MLCEAVVAPLAHDRNGPLPEQVFGTECDVEPVPATDIFGLRQEVVRLALLDRADRAFADRRAVGIGRTGQEPRRSGDGAVLAQLEVDADLDVLRIAHAG